MKNKLKLLIPLITSLAFIVPGVAHGQLASAVEDIYNTALGIGGALAFVMILVGAIYYSVSGGSPDKKSEGKDYITSALWGLVLLLGAFLILNTINPQITDISNPSVTPIGDASCSNNPGLNECEDQSPFDSEGNIRCCVSFGDESQAGSCPQQVFENCETTPITVGSVDNISQPYCEGGDGTPSCESGGFYAQPKCNEGQPQCEGGSVPLCNDNGEATCSTSKAGSAKNVINCGNCSDGIKTTEVDIVDGGGYIQYPYFGENQDPGEAQCVTYAYKKGADATWQYANIDNVKYCK